LPIHARGATPESPDVGGWSAPEDAVVPATPAAIPPTCVPWKEACGSSASRPGRPAPGPGKARATITFSFVQRRPPRGKPAGYEKPTGLKNGFAWSTPSSTTAIFTPAPRAPVAVQNVSAPISDGLRFVRSE
jgi:hypothetical protein